MAEGSGGNVALGVILGAVLVVVVLLFAFGGIPGLGGGGNDADLEITIDTPDAPSTE